MGAAPRPLIDRLRRPHRASPYHARLRNVSLNAGCERGNAWHRSRTPTPRLQGQTSPVVTVSAARLTSSAEGVTYNHMVVETREREKQTDRLFFALSDATRRDIVTETLDRERSVSELGRRYPISLTAVQKHVEVLVDAGLVSKHRSGREQLVRGELNQLRRAHELLDELETLWRARLERFEDVLNESTGKENE
jgi:DNA-binding transcriptional ArsR family regulator